ncbi:MAG: DNA internalization-related competence protein ComEC/Rec2 [Candidatus Electrothrix sp. YB6]
MQPCICWCDRNILLPVTLCFLAGTAAGNSSCSSSPLLSEGAAVIALLLLSAAALLLFLYRRYKALSLFLSLPLFFLIGYLNAAAHLQIPRAAGHIAALLQEQQQVTLVGTLVTMIEESGTPDVEDEEQEVRSRFELEVQDILLHDGRQSWQPTHGRVRLSMRGSMNRRKNRMQPGVTLMVSARAGPVTGFQVPGAFDYPAYLAAKGIYISGYIRSDRHIAVLREQKRTALQKQLRNQLRRLRYLPEQIRQRVSLFLRQHLNPSVAGTYQALLIGSRAGVSQEIQEQFKATGTMHLLAISGLHMGLLGIMVGGGISLLLKRSERLLLHVHVPTISMLAALPVLFSYSLIAGLNTPVVRALIMAVVLLAAVVLRRQGAMLHLAATAALAVSAINPLTVQTASFQLSFSAVTALALFLPKILSSSVEESGSAPDDPQQDRLRKILHRYLLLPVLVSVTATLGTLPFMLFHFHRFSLIGPVMNLLVEPFFCFWALPWGLAAVPCIFFAPEAAAVLLRIGGLGITAGQYCTAAGSALPWASLWTITPTGAEIFFYGLLMLVWRSGFRVLWIRSAALAGSILLLIHFTWNLWFPTVSETSQVTFLDVGQGSSCFLRLPDGIRILVDGGSGRGERFNIGEQVIGPYLWKQRIWRLDQAVISHPHSDHFNGMDFVLAHFRPKKLYINGDAHREETYQQILDQAAEQGTRIMIPKSGNRIAGGENAALTVIGMNGLPGSSSITSVNDASLVLRYRHGRRTFLLPGDIEEPSEHVLLQQRADITADVLLSPHHGSSTSSSRDFLAAVDPSLIVVSAGKYGKKYYPAPANLAFWQAQNIPVAITREQGTVTCTTDGKELRCGSAEDRSDAADLLFTD